MRVFPERLGFSRSNASRFGPTEQTQRIDDEHWTALETSPSRLRHPVIKVDSTFSLPIATTI